MAGATARQQRGAAWQMPAFVFLTDLSGGDWAQASAYAAVSATLGRAGLATSAWRINDLAASGLALRRALRDRQAANPGAKARLREEAHLAAAAILRLLRGLPGWTAKHERELLPIWE